MSDLPYTLDHPDPLSAISITIDDDGMLTLQDAFEGMEVPLDNLTPTEAARLARAVLAAAGHTGHIVVSTQDSARAIRIRQSIAAESMIAEIRDRVEAASPGPWVAGWRNLAPNQVMISPDLPPTELSCDEQGELNAAFIAAARTDVQTLLDMVDHLQEQPADVHMATPEGVTPCGHGIRDVTCENTIDEVTCVGCLQTIAIEKGGQIVETQRERDRLRTAWESARRRALNERETAGMERFFAHDHGAEVVRLRRKLHELTTAQTTVAQNNPTPRCGNGNPEQGSHTVCIRLGRHGGQHQDKNGATWGDPLNDRLDALESLTAYLTDRVKDAETQARRANRRLDRVSENVSEAVETITNHHERLTDLETDVTPTP